MRHSREDVHSLGEVGKESFAVVCGRPKSSIAAERRAEHRTVGVESENVGPPVVCDVDGHSVLEENGDVERSELFDIPIIDHGPERVIV